MTNKDANGRERPWMLHTEQYGISTRSRIVPNPDYEVDHPDRSGVDYDWALTLAMEDAVLHLQQDAARAVAAHIRDAHLWKAV